MALHNQAVENRQTLLIPTKYAHIPISKLATEDLKFPLLQFQPKDDGFLEMVHDALMLRSDIRAQPRYEGFNVNEDDALRMKNRLILVRFVFLHLYVLLVTFTCVDKLHTYMQTFSCIIQYDSYVCMFQHYVILRNYFNYQ